MYGLPSGFDPSIFVGRELIQLSFTTNTLDILFDGDTAITLEGGFEFQRSAGDTPERQRVPVKASSLMSLLGARVQSATGTLSGALKLHFETGASLTCLDDVQYESYHIRSPTLNLTV